VERCIRVYNTQKDLNQSPITTNTLLCIRLITRAWFWPQA